MTRRLLLVATIAISLGGPPLLSAQGCSLCRDAAAGSAPRMRRALRLAIPLLGVPASGIFVAILVMARRLSPIRDDA